MTTVQAILWVLGVAAAIAVICAIAIYVENRYTISKYDERQKASRDAGYRVAFYVGIFYYFFMMIDSINPKNLDMEVYLIFLFGFQIQMMTVHIYGLLTDSALPLGDNPLTSVLCYSGMGLFQLLGIPRWGEYEGFPLFGEGSSKWLNLTMGIFFLLLALAHLISMLRRRKED